MINRIDHVNIVVTDLELAADFFRTLGFHTTAPAELRGEWISAIVGLDNVQARYVVVSHPGSTTNIELIAYGNPPSPAASTDIAKANKVGFRHLAFEVDDIDAEVTRLRRAGVPLCSEVHVYPKTGKKLIYFTGPEGILLELAEYPRDIS